MGNSSSIGAHIENAKRTGICSLTDMKLKEVPPEFLKLNQNLRTVDLSRNRLSILPIEFGGFKALKSLTINQNALSSVPDEIGKLSKLETLSLDNNHISMISQTTLSGLQNLKSISLCGNNLAHIPNGLFTLSKLDVVNLSSNKIQDIPEDVRHFNGIELNFNGNRLKTLCPQLIDCERLKVLRIEENCLTLNAIGTDLLINSSIALIAYDGNLFSTKQLQDKDGYEQYIERFTATKKKFL